MVGGGDAVGETALVFLGMWLVVMLVWTSEEGRGRGVLRRGFGRLLGGRLGVLLGGGFLLLLSF